MLRLVGSESAEKISAVTLVHLLFTVVKIHYKPFVN